MMPSRIQVMSKVLLSLLPWNFVFGILLLMVSRWLPVATEWWSSIHIQWKKEKNILPGMRYKYFPLDHVAKVISMTNPGAVTVARESYWLAWANDLMWSRRWGSTAMSITDIVRASQHHHPAHTDAHVHTLFTALASSPFHSLRHLLPQRRHNTAEKQTKALDFNV